MNQNAVIKEATKHIVRGGSHLKWFVGVRPNARIHPWDEQDLPYSTSRWLDLEADTHLEAESAARELCETGLAGRLASTPSVQARHVFVFASEPN